MNFLLFVIVATLVGVATIERVNASSSSSSAKAKSATTSQTLVPTIANMNDLDKWRSKSEHFVLGLFKKNSPSHAANKEIFVKLAAKFPDLPFGLTYESSIFANMGVDKDENVVFLRRFVEEREQKTVYTGSFNEHSLNKFIVVNHSPLVSYWEEKTRKEVLNGPIKVVLLFFVFIRKEKDRWEFLLKDYEKLARKYRGRVVFSIVDMGRDSSQDLMRYMSIKKSHKPRVRALSFFDGTSLTRHKPKSAKFKYGVVDAFLQRLVDKELKPFYDAGDDPKEIRKVSERLKKERRKQREEDEKDDNPSEKQEERDEDEL